MNIEINDSENVQVAGRDIHIHQTRRNPLNIKMPSKEEVIDFFKIYWEAWTAPHKLVERSTVSGTLNWDAIVFHLLTLLLVVSIYYVVFDKLSILLQFPEALAMLRRKALEIVFSIKILFQFATILILTLILWSIYKTAKSSTGYLKTLNYQFYFLSAWLPLILGILLAWELHRINNLSTTLLYVLMFCTGICGLYVYFKGISLLTGTHGKRGFLYFSCYLVVVITYKRLFF